MQWLLVVDIFILNEIMTNVGVVFCLELCVMLVMWPYSMFACQKR